LDERRERRADSRLNAGSPQGPFGAARWSGRRWHNLELLLSHEAGQAAPGSVRILVAPNGDLLIGGGFDQAGGAAHADYIARWHDGRWQALGPGLGGDVNTLAVAPNGDIVVGGSFTALGDGSRPLFHLAIYRDR
ncbi:MAG: hypothetical protein ACRYFX_23600, partial [Janthinobacterium lividum]